MREYIYNKEVVYDNEMSRNILQSTDEDRSEKYERPWFSRQDEEYFIEGQFSRGRVPDISFRPRDGTPQVNLRMGPSQRAPNTECKYKCGETTGVFTLLGTSPTRIQMIVDWRVAGPFGQAPSRKDS